MMCKLSKKKQPRRKNLLSLKTACLFLLLSFIFSILAACSDPGPAQGDTAGSSTISTTDDDQIIVPTPDDDGIEPIFYVGLPGEREDRFSFSYAKMEDLTLNPFCDVQKEDIFSPCNFIYDKLLHYNKNDGLYESNIIESIDLSGQEFTLYLHKDISFHNGFNLTANDVLQTFALFQSSGHELGQRLNDAIAFYAMDGNFTVKITLSDNEDALLTLFECLERIPVLPYQLWGARVPAGSDLASLEEITPLPMIGSGPYRLLRQDRFALVLEKHNQTSLSYSSARFDEYPQYLVYYKYQKDKLAQAALAHNDLDLLVRSEKVHPQKALENILNSFKDINFWEPGLAENIFTVSASEKRIGIALNPVSEQLKGIAARKVVQSFMLKLDDLQQSLYPSVSNTISLPAANQLTLPSILPHELTRTDFQFLPDTSPQEISAYLDQSSWERNPQSGVIVDEKGNPIELDFYYPVATIELANVFRQIIAEAAENGLTITGREISVEEWRTRLQTHDYDLIYMESLPDETIPQMIARIQLWPGLAAESELKDTNDFAAESGRQLLWECKNDALDFDSIITCLQNLNIFLLENNLFFPLGITYETGGVGNELFFSSELSEQLQNH